MKRHHILLAAVTVFLAGCFEHEDQVETAPSTLTAETPNSFLRSINPRAGLSAGEYRVIAATNSLGESGSYQLVITRDDGSVETINGNWTSSGGASASAVGNKMHALSMSSAGGISIALNSTAADAYLFLVYAGGSVLAKDDDSGGPSSGGGGRTNALIELQPRGTSSAAYAQAYYDAVDPLGERATLDGYLKKNCFIPATPAEPDCADETIGMGFHAIFRDARDLGYGRNMHARRNINDPMDPSDDTFAFVVGNYVVKLGAGGSSNYGPINVEAAVAADARYHLGTNAIEFSPNPIENSPDGEHIAKFFTFNPDGERITSADLDGRGVKHMPEMCWVCHGGRTMPLEADGSFPLLSLRSPKYNQLEPDSFDYSLVAGWSRADMEAPLRLMNEMVRDSYLQIQARDDGYADKWFADFGIELAEARYGGATFPSPVLVEDYVPDGWQQTPSRPEGVEQLFKRVIEPHCIGCHALQGNNAGENSGQPFASAVNFQSWEKFYSYRSIVADYVFRRGVMPLSLRNWESFWKYPDDKPALLASFLNDASLFDSTGHVIRPGLPVARPGADRTAPSPVQLDGNASSYAGSYSWSIVSQPDGSSPVLSSTTSARPVLTTAMDGDYVIALMVSNAKGSSAPVAVTITVDNAMDDPTTLTFVDDIAPILGSTTGVDCAGCHNASGGYPGIPVYWDDSNPNLYRDVRARVNLAEPELSLLLVKPTGPRHGGGEYINLLLLADQEKYNTIVQWIRAGAPCGVSDVTISCD